MKVVELRLEQESDFPVKSLKELNIFSEYYVVNKSNKSISILRYIEDVKKWYFIGMDNFCTNKLVLNVEELLDRFYVYCLPGYTGGCCDSFKDEEESKKQRIKLLEFLINKYWKNRG